MPSTTPILSLALYNATTDQAETFSAFRAAQAGTSGSNMLLIDTAIGNLQDDLITVAALKGIALVDMTYISPGYFTGTNVGIESYATDMFVALALSQASDGSTVVNINSLGDVTLKKVSGGALVNIAAGELAALAINLFVYDGTYFVLVGKHVVPGTAGNFVKIGTTNLPEDSTYKAADFAVAAAGVTNGNSHDHSGGDGGQIDHTGLSNIGTNAHSTIDSHIGSTSNPHGVTSQQVLGTGTAGQVRKLTASNTDAWIDDDYSISVIIGDMAGTTALTTGIKGYVPVPVAGTIESMELVADATGSIVVDIWKDTYANYPPTVADTITASAKPTLSSAQKAQDATLTGWTKTLAKGDYLAYNIDSATTVKQITLTLYIKKTAVS